MKTQLLKYISGLNNDQLSSSLSVRVGHDDDFVDIGGLHIEDTTLIMYVLDEYHENSLSYEELYHFITEVNKAPFTKIEVDFENGETNEPRVEVKKLEIDETNEFEDTLGMENHPYFELA